MTSWWLGLAITLAVGLMIAAIVGAFSKRQRCWWRTTHSNHEALGSGMTKSGPHFIYRCRDCGTVWLEKW